MSYEEGDRVELVSTSDPHTSLEPGARGTVQGVDTIPLEVTGRNRPETQVWVEWDNGSRLAMILGEDRLERVTEAEA